MCYAMIDPARVRTMVLFRTSAHYLTISSENAEDVASQSKSGANEGTSPRVLPCFDLTRSFPGGLIRLITGPCLHTAMFC